VGADGGGFDKIIGALRRHWSGAGTKRENQKQRQDKTAAHQCDGKGTTRDGQLFFAFPIVLTLCATGAVGFGSLAMILLLADENGTFMELKY
jgi:hypothetical protein